ncbi:DHA2 family efflux MFS transporter permease subunit [Cryptosporangium phraense]|uniref:DHA2 family efflux MFS transporter permease subunit n=1 Tax=Cryptosporangium phraense TaxID=2593070 RepID=UPI001478673F|nr:DHA2 family efflux MFS transporter permease subunit [Cryptosporangium phraense]
MTVTEDNSKLTPELLKLAGVIMLGAIMMQLDVTMMSIATNTLINDFHTTLSTFQWVSTGYLLSMASVIPIAGWALERYGARTMWMFTLVVFLLGSVLCGMAWSIGSLIVFRVIQGIGAGMILPLAQSILAIAAGPERLGRVMATIGLPALLGPVLGPILGGLIVTNLSWRWIFYVNLPICALALLLAPRFLPRIAPGAARTPLDVLGLVLLAPAFAAMIYGFAEAGRNGSFSDVAVIGPVVGGLALLVLFTLHSIRRGARALIDVRLFRVRSFAAAAGLIVVASGVMFGALGLLPLYYQQVRAEDALHTGLLLIPLGLGMGSSLVVAGRLADRFPAGPIALVGLVLGGLGGLAYTALGAGTSYVLIGLAEVLSGIGIGAVLVPVMSAALRGLSPEAIPRASVSVRIFQQLGASLGSAVLFVALQRQITDRVSATGPTPDALASSFGSTFWWIVAFAAVAVVPALFLPFRRRRAVQPSTEELTTV